MDVSYIIIHISFWKLKLDDMSHIVELLVGGQKTHVGESFGH